MKKEFNTVFVNVCNYQFQETEVIPLGQLSLATILFSKKICNAKVIDINYLYSHNILKKSRNINQMIIDTAEYILRERPDFISFYTMCNIQHYVLLISEYIKKKNSSITICLAGPHATTTAASCLELYPYIDFVALGEGELTIESIVQGVKEDDLEQCKGIAYRTGEGVAINVFEYFVENLDDIPLINYELLNFIPSAKIHIEVGRGCPFSCSFCTTNKFWNQKYRIKSAKRIMKEIMQVYETFGITQFTFEHDLFLLNKQVVLEVCNKIIESNIKITWGCSSRIDCIDEELISMMAQAGCIRIFFGIETGSVRLQKEINKNLDLSKVNELISELKKVNISPTFSFIYGFPTETEDDIESTLDFMYKIYDRYYKNYFRSEIRVQLHKLIFLPGTKITTENYKELRLSKYLRTDLQYDETSWENEQIVKLISEKKVFSQFFELQTDFLLSITGLDVFYGFLFNYFIEYLDITYKALLYHYSKHLYLFQGFLKIIGISNINKVFQREDLRNYDIILWAIKLMYKFIKASEFDENTELINNIFDFEYAIFMQKHKKKAEKVIYVNYDVFEMKRRRELLFIPQAMVIEFKGEEIIRRCL